VLTELNGIELAIPGIKYYQDSKFTSSQVADENALSATLMLRLAAPSQRFGIDEDYVVLIGF
jgi:hypothetical protein